MDSHEIIIGEFVASVLFLKHSIETLSGNFDV